LSIPSTVSSNVRVANAIQFSGDCSSASIARLMRPLGGRDLL
jgi:hypothetical protein